MYYIIVLYGIPNCVCLMKTLRRYVHTYINDKYSDPGNMYTL